MHSQTLQPTRSTVWNCNFCGENQSSTYGSQKSYNAVIDFALGKNGNSSTTDAISPNLFLSSCKLSCLSCSCCNENDNYNDAAISKALAGIDNGSESDSDENSQSDDCK